MIKSCGFYSVNNARLNLLGVVHALSETSRNYVEDTGFEDTPHLTLMI